jgi:hypothetical protein
MLNGELKVCPVCEKRFIPTVYWAYKKEKGTKIIHYCSYHCYREAGGGKEKFKNFPKQRGERYA